MTKAELQTMLGYILDEIPTFRRAASKLGYEQTSDLISSGLVQACRVPESHWSSGRRILRLTNRGHQHISPTLKGDE